MKKIIDRLKIIRHRLRDFAIPTSILNEIDNIIEELEG